MFSLIQKVIPTLRKEEKSVIIENISSTNGLSDQYYLRTLLIYVPHFNSIQQRVRS